MDNKVEMTVLEHCHIFPSSDGSIGKKMLPLSFMDIPWVCEYPVSQQVTFYQLPHPKSHFIDTVIPNLKQSLSVALKHFFLLAGNLIVYPFTDPNIIPRKPEICFVEGEGSVSFLVAESENNFSYLTGNHARKSNDFYPLAAKLKDITRDSSSGVIKVPLLAIQVTLFPNHGLCIATTAHHSSFDASSIFNFQLAWASITKFGDDLTFQASGNLPLFDRSFIKDPKGLDSLLWQNLSVTRNQEAQPLHVLPDNDDEVRATFIMTRDQINNIKKSIMSQRPTLAPYLSSFTIVCAHVMSCIAKADDTIGEEYYDQLMLVIAVECRARLDPQVPKTYFGNCFVLCAPEVKRDQLIGESGLIDACEMIGEAIRSTTKSNESIYACTEFWSQDLSKYSPAAIIGVTGSPKFDVYEVDFGWGKPNKFEIFTTHGYRELCLGACKKSKEDIEIGLSLSKIQMAAFETINVPKKTHIYQILCKLACTIFNL